MVKRAGLIGVGALACGLVFFGAEEPVAGIPATSTPVAAPPPAADVVAPQVMESAREAVPPASMPTLTRPGQPAPAGQPERRGNRRPRRNVWVGPIPTPADWAAPE